MLEDETAIGESAAVLEVTDWVIGQGLGVELITQESKRSPGELAYQAALGAEQAVDGPRAIPTCSATLRTERE